MVEINGLGLITIGLGEVIAIVGTTRLAPMVGFVGGHPQPSVDEPFAMWMA